MYLVSNRYCFLLFYFFCSIISNRVRMDDSGNLIFTKLTSSDEGRYQCLAQNVVATRETPAVLLSIHGSYITTTSVFVVYVTYVAAAAAGSFYTTRKRERESLSHNIRASSSISSYACRIGWIAARPGIKKEEGGKGKLDFLIFYSRVAIRTCCVYPPTLFSDRWEWLFAGYRRMQPAGLMSCSILVYSLFWSLSDCVRMVEWYYIEFTRAKCLEYWIAIENRCFAS